MPKSILTDTVSFDLICYLFLSVFSSNSASVVVSEKVDFTEGMSLNKI